MSTDMERIECVARGMKFAWVAAAGVASAFLLIAVDELIAKSSPVPGEGTSHALTPPAFTGRRGVGGIKTFGFPMTLAVSRSKFARNPYRPSWEKEMLSGRTKEIVGAGFDFLRVNINPGPIMAAEGEEREQLLDEIDFAVASTVNSGLGVVIDIHVSEGHPDWGVHQVTAGPEGPAFLRYLEALRGLAQIASRYPPSKVALEVFNEPPSPCKWSKAPSWPALVSIIHAEARRLLPRHTLVVGGACYASIEGLLELDGSAFDANTMFTVHYYEPFLFTHQGYWGASNKFVQYLAPLPYPADPKLARATIERVSAALKLAGDLQPDERATEQLEARRALLRYFGRPFGPDALRQRFEKISAWAKLHEVPPSRILIGEFGAMKDIFGKKGALPADRYRWLADVRRAAEGAGFAWSVWALTNTMGIVMGDLSGPLDAGALEALGLSPSSSQGETRVR